MQQYLIHIGVDADQTKKLSATYSVGELQHEDDFSWSPTATHTNGDHFFDVPMLSPDMGSRKR